RCAAGAGAGGRAPASDRGAESQAGGRGTGEGGEGQAGGRGLETAGTRADHGRAGGGPAPVLGGGQGSVRPIRTADPRGEAQGFSREPCARKLRQDDRGSAALVDARALASEVGKLPPVFSGTGYPHKTDELFRCQRRDRRPARPPVTDRADAVVEDPGRFPLGKRLSVAAQD